MAEETLCPRCGYTPIPEGAERCPRCDAPFRPELRDDTSVTRTRAGGLTGAVTANPAPAAVVLAAGAIFWVLRASNLLGPGESLWGFLVAALSAAAAALLMATVGPAKHAAVVIGVIELVAGAAMWLTDSPARLFFATAAHGLVLIGMTAEEPGRLRLTLGAVLGCVAAAGGVVALAWQQLPVGPQRAVLGGRAAGFELTLPLEWAEVPGPSLFPMLTLPADAGVGAEGARLGFTGASVPHRVGALIVSPWQVKELMPPEAWLALLCGQTLQQLGAVSIADLAFPAPPAFGAPNRVGELKTTSGATGRFVCGVSKGRFVALAVVGDDPAADTSAPAFEELAAGLVVR